MSGQNLLPQPQQCWAALNPSLSCFPHWSDSKRAKKIQGIFRWSQPTGLPGTHRMWEFQQLSETGSSQIFISAPRDLQWSSTETYKSTRSKVSNTTGYSRNFHSTSSPIFPLKPEISKNLEPTGQFLQYIHLCFSRCYFFQRIFLDMLVMSVLFYP